MKYLSVLLLFSYSLYGQGDTVKNKLLVGATLGGIISEERSFGEENINDIVKASKYRGDFRINSYYYFNKFIGIYSSIGFFSGYEKSLPELIENNYQNEIIKESSDSKIYTSGGCDLLLGYSQIHQISKKFDFLFNVHIGVIRSGFIESYIFNTVNLMTLDEKFYRYELQTKKTSKLKMGAETSFNFYCSKNVAFQANFGVGYWNKGGKYLRTIQDKNGKEEQRTYTIDYSEINPKITLGVYLYIDNFVNFWRQ